MADSQDVQDSEITPEDFDEEQETPKAESSPAKSEEKEEKSEEKPEESKEEEQKESEEDSEKTEEEDDKESQEAEKSEKSPAEERKTQLNSEIRDLVAQRNSLREEVTKANSEAYQPATEEDLVKEGMEPAEAKVEALRQEIEMREFNNQVAEAQLTIESESNRVLSDFAWANPESDTFNKELATEAARLLEGNLITDPNTGQVIGSNISPYQLYKTLDRAAGISSTEGRLKAQKDTEKMLASADTSSSSAPAKKSEDPLAKLWESEL